MKLSFKLAFAGFVSASLFVWPATSAPLLVPSKELLKGVHVNVRIRRQRSGFEHEASLLCQEIPRHEIRMML